MTDGQRSSQIHKMRLVNAAFSIYFPYLVALQVLLVTVDK